LSSTEAEVFALSEVAMELFYMKQVVDSMGHKMSFPIIMKVDNFGDINLAN
jgi:hypothetical protein